MYRKAIVILVALVLIVAVGYYSGVKSPSNAISKPLSEKNSQKSAVEKANLKDVVSKAAQIAQRHRVVAGEPKALENYLSEISSQTQFEQEEYDNLRSEIMVKVKHVQELRNELNKKILMQVSKDEIAELNKVFERNVEILAHDQIQMNEAYKTLQIAKEKVVSNIVINTRE